MDKYIVVNFSHPMTPQAQAALQAMLHRIIQGGEGEALPLEVIDVKFHADDLSRIGDEVRAAVKAAEAKAGAVARWAAYVPPGLGVAAAAMERHFAMDHELQPWIVVMAQDTTKVVGPARFMPVALV